MDYFKLTTENDTHNGYQYKEGLNCLDGEFNNEKVCGSGGLYFCRKEDIGKWTYYNEKQMHYIWDVKLCEDSKIVDMGDKLKTDKFILSNKRSIWDNGELCKLACIKNGKALKFVKNELMTDEICKLAVSKNGISLMYVPPELMSEEIFKLAVRQIGLSLSYVPPELMSEEICKLAVQQNGYALKYVKPELMSEEICKLAVRQNGYSLRCVEEQTEEICKLAVQQNGDALQYVKKQTDEICKLAVQHKMAMHYNILKNKQKKFVN